MADDKVVVSRQRNLNDVAMELTELYLKKFYREEMTKEQLADTYKFFHKTAVVAEYGE